jgi:hypothetical protein
MRIIINFLKERAHLLDKLDGTMFATAALIQAFPCPP